MRFPPQFLDEIRARVPLSSVIGPAVQWDRKKTNAGRGDYWACCPFHHEKTPSFHADDGKGRYHCFGCKASGDIFRFLTEKHGLTFPEAVEQLAGQAGLAMPQMTAEAVAREERRASLYDVMELAAGFFEAQLHEAAGAAARGYLADRGVNTQVQQAFRIGFAPNDRQLLKRHLDDKGIEASQMAEAGLLVSGEDIAVPYDRFRNRIMFPIRDSRGRVIAFGGRAMSSEALAKYLNSPEGPLFHKSHVLYNWDRARGPAHRAGQMIVVEGYMDVIAMDRAGFNHAVAPLGTALTEAQLGLLWQSTPEPVVCFDGDAAGVKAALRALDIALPLLRPGHSIRFAMLPDGQDPDDLLKNDGPEAIAAVISGAQPLVDILWQSLLEENDRRTPEARARFEVDVQGRVNRIEDPKVRHHYQSELRERVRTLWSQARPEGGTRSRHGKSRRPDAWLKVPPSGARRGLKPWMRAEPPTQRLRALAATTGLAQAAQRKEQLMLLALINHPRLLEEYAENLADAGFVSRDLDRLRGLILDAAALTEALDSAAIRSHLKREGHGETLLGLESALAGSNEWFVLPEAAFEDVLVGFRQLFELHRKSVALETQLKQAEQALADMPSEKNLNHLNDVREQLNAAAGEEANVDGFGEASGRVTRSAI